MFNKQLTLAVLSCVRDSLGWALCESQGGSSYEELELILSSIPVEHLEAADVRESFEEALHDFELLFGKEEAEGIRQSVNVR